LRKVFNVQLKISHPKSLLLICALALFLIVPVRAGFISSKPSSTALQLRSQGYYPSRYDAHSSMGFHLWLSVGLGKEIGIKNSPAASPLPIIDVGEKIKEGILLLKSSPPLVYKTKNGKPTGDLVKKQIALAILDTASGKVFEKRMWVKEEEIKNYRETGIINLEPANLPTSDITNLPMSDVGINVRVRWWNSFNTFYEVESKPDLIVVANKYLLPSSYIIGLPERSKTKYTDIIYAPYSASIHLPEIIAAGKQYLDDNVDQAFGQLNLAGVVSHSSSGKLVTAVIGKELVKNIILIEHIDPDSFSAAPDGGRELTERVLAIIGANQNFAYRYTGSPAGASGLAQFIKATYKTIVSKYPDAHLIKDYNLGMADHTNAIKAMVLFFDNYKNEIENKVTRRDVVNQMGITEEMLAAAYNGGPGKVVRSVNKYGLAWISSQFALPRAKAVFKQETLNYIQKFRSIKGLNFF